MPKYHISGTIRVDFNTLYLDWNGTIIADDPDEASQELLESISESEFYAKACIDKYYWDTVNVEEVKDAEI